MQELIKNKSYEITIESYSSEGDGVGHLFGMAVFVKGALKGETLVVSPIKITKKCAWARIVKILAPSPTRIEPDCKYYKLCGGCRLRHMTYEEELKFKLQRVNDALKHIGNLDCSADIIHTSENTDRYRNKVAFPVKYDAKNGNSVGFYRERSHDVIDIDKCLLQADQADKVGRIVRKWMNKYNIPAYDETTGQGLIRHILVRTNRTRQVLICIISNSYALPFCKELITALKIGCPKSVGIVLNTNTRITNVILGDKYTTLWGQDFILDRICGLTFKLSVPSFFQVNRNQAEVLYSKAVEFAGLTGKETVLDLYCGTGTISLVMARQAKQVIGVEIVAAAINNAKENAQRNGFKNVDFICGDAGKTLDLLQTQNIKPDVVCIDPPRKGLERSVIDIINAMNPNRVVYVSCDPATLARDLKIFDTLDYAVTHIECVDMFPRTPNCESVCLLTKK